MNFLRKIFEIKEIVQDQADAVISFAEAEERLRDLLLKVYHAGVSAAVDSDIRQKVRDELANDPNCYD
jgi:hypothetical protein